MDEQTKQALQELKETTDRFAANCDRWIAEGDAQVEEMRQIVLELRIGAARTGNVLDRAAVEARKCR